MTFMTLSELCNDFGDLVTIILGPLSVQTFIFPNIVKYLKNYTKNWHKPQLYFVCSTNQQMRYTQMVNMIAGLL